MEPEIKVQLARHVNDLICERLAEADSEAPIAFFCECGGERCFGTVWLRPAEYLGNRSTGAWFALAERHDKARVADFPATTAAP